MSAGKWQRQHVEAHWHWHGTLACLPRTHTHSGHISTFDRYSHCVAFHVATRWQVTGTQCRSRCQNVLLALYRLLSTRAREIHMTLRSKHFHRTRDSCASIAGDHVKSSVAGLKLLSRKSVSFRRWKFDIHIWCQLRGGDGGGWAVCRIDCDMMNRFDFAHKFRCRHRNVFFTEIAFG